MKKANILKPNSTEENENQAILEKYDKGGSFRTFRDARGLIISAILICFSLFQLLTTWFVIPSTHMRPIHMSIIVSMAYILFPVSKGSSRSKLPWYDVVLAILSLCIYLYPVIAFDQMIGQFGYTDIQIFIGLLGIILLLEACRRVVGLPIVIVSLCFITIGLLGPIMPGFLANRGFKVSQLVQHLFYTQEGIFGTPVGASSTFIFLFILFGAFLEKTGVGAFFIDFANSLCGHKRGGPAKVAVITSALMGTVSGSSVANTVGSGSFTIPMMKRLGYKPEFAAAVEASASTGGQLMPPVMGAAAFLMAENLGIPFSAIIKAAIIPAVLYFAGIYIITDIEAKKLGLNGMSKDELPKFTLIMKTKGYLILPLIVIIVLLTIGYTASFAALAGIIAAILVNYIPTFSNFVKRILKTNNEKTQQSCTKHEGIKIADYFGALESGSRSIISVSLACGVAGIIVGMITKTGIGLKMGAGLSNLANGNIYILLILTMLASIVLGMGVPTTPNYLITSTIMAPIIYKAIIEYLPDLYNSLITLGEGYALLPAHMFSFYFGIIADITPPVALAAMAGAAIAKADPLKSGINSSKLAIAAFIVPFIFMMNPKMLMLNAEWYEILQIIVTAFIGMLGISMSIEKYWNTKLSVFQQIITLAGGLCLIIPGIVSDIIGLILVGTVMLIQKVFLQRKASI